MQLHSPQLANLNVKHSGMLSKACRCCPDSCTSPLKVVYDNGPVKDLAWEDFDTLRKRVAEEWDALPKLTDNISDSLKAKIKAQMEARGKQAKF
jgi:hypothetical protein